MTNTETNAQIAGNGADSSEPAKNSKPKSSAVSKKTGNKNALCHGVFSNELILPWESPEDLEKLHAAFKDEWKPNGCSEEQAVLDLTHCTWIGWRAAKMAHLSFQRAPFGTGLFKSGKTQWQDILHFQQELPETTVSALAQIDTTLSGMNDMLEQVRKFPYPTGTSDGKAMQMDLAKLVSLVGQTIDTFKNASQSIRKLAAATDLQWNIFDSAYQPEVIEQQVKVMAAIDARKDKIIRRLTAIKEYKRAAASMTPPPQLIASPSVAPAESTGDIK
jgi:hypothetical protein